MLEVYHFCITVFMFSEKNDQSHDGVTFAQVCAKENMISYIWRTEILVHNISAALWCFITVLFCDLFYFHYMQFLPTGILYLTIFQF